MKLKKILENVEVISLTGNDNINIKDMFFVDSQVVKGSVFFCMSGTSHDGHNYAASAEKNGAVCLVVEKEIITTNANTVVVKVKNTRIAMSIMAKNFFGKCCDKLKIIGVTGTNGKTSISYILANIFKSAGTSVAIIGTNGTVVGDIVINSKLTTPDPIELHYIFKQLYNLQVKVVVMEVSAQALHFSKIEGIKFEVGIITNITNEHLDFFKTMENYKQVKFSFLSQKYVKTAVVNADDESCLEYINNQNILPVFSYGVANPSSTFAINITMSIKETKFVVNANDNIFEVKTKLLGVYNVYNILACINAALLCGLSVDNIIKGIDNTKQIPGRMNIFNLDCNNKVVVDYAHTPDWFKKVLELIRSLRQGKIITIFGCVGYSDSEKRKQMGKIASEYSDYIILTADNPNYKNTDTINSDIESGFDTTYKNYKKIADRKEAVKCGFDMLFENDTLVLLGKGVETSNKINGVDVVYSDIVAINELIEKFYNLKCIKNETVKEEKNGNNII